MENNELDKKIINHVRNKIVISNLEREASMKLNRKKQIISLCATVIVILSGGFLTVNAATDGKLAQEIKNKYEEIQIKIDGDEYKITRVENTVDENGDNHAIYTIKSDDDTQEIEADINKTQIDKENMEVTETITEDEQAVITFDYK